MPNQPTPRAYLTDQQIANLAYNAGFRGEALRWAVAIARAESSGDPNSYNPEIAAGTVKNSGSRGLWQIYGAAHPQFNNNFTFDPEVNARAAFQVYREAGMKFTPWSTFNNGMAKGFYNQLRYKEPTGDGTREHAQPIKAGLPGSGNSAASDPNAGAIQQSANALQDIASGKFITNIFAGFDKVSFGFYAAGAILIMIGLAVIFAKPAAQIAVTGTQIASVL